ncbi:hypothetical protein LIER_15431 [Lithospermum erythrorhizon]|uniref:Uncharacterized protein n=1 Tax=Lithospermum erythrorhizon TaxID=34254 RepID=A0AAV3Q5D9_LITER
MTVSRKASKSVHRRCNWLCLMLTEDRVSTLKALLVRRSSVKPRAPRGVGFDSHQRDEETVFSQAKLGRLLFPNSARRFQFPGQYNGL